MGETQLQAEYDKIYGTYKEMEDKKTELEKNPRVNVRKIQQLERKMLKYAPRVNLMSNLLSKYSSASDFKTLEANISDDGVKFSGRSDNVIECNPA